MGHVGLTNDQTSLTNGHTSLPQKDSPEIHLVIGTEDEILDSERANSAEWRGALSLEAYLRREDVLSNQDLTRDGGLTNWMLVHQPNGSDKRRVLCSCETIKKKALVGRNGEVEEAVAHGVGSVFCASEYRGRGYAGRMLTAVGKRLKGWQADDGKRVLFSMLYSDIGKTFYAARGWQPFPSAHVALPAASNTANHLSPVRLLSSEDLGDLCALDDKLMRRRMANMKGVAAALVADRETLRWHHAREEFVAKELLNMTPEIKGAIVGQAGSRVWCFWTRVWTNPQEEGTNTLHILRLVIEDEAFSDFAPASSEGAAQANNSTTTAAISALFAAAQSQAAQWGMKEVQIWNPTSTTLAAAKALDTNAVVAHREKESITSLLWYGEDSWENVDWICNEKYAWS